MKPLEESLFDLNKVPTVEDACKIVRNVSSMQQFKRSLEFVQGGTNMTLDRMIVQLDKVGAECFLQGIDFCLGHIIELEKEKIENASVDSGSVPKVAQPSNPIGQFSPSGSVLSSNDQSHIQVEGATKTESKPK